MYILAICKLFDWDQPPLKWIDHHCVFEDSTLKILGRTPLFIEYITEKVQYGNASVLMQCSNMIWPSWFYKLKASVYLMWKGQSNNSTTLLKKCIVYIQVVVQIMLLKSFNPFNYSFTVSISPFSCSIGRHAPCGRVHPPPTLWWTQLWSAAK